MIEQVIRALSASSDQLITFILAMLPVSELRGAIPFGLSMGLELKRVLVLSIIGNLIPVIPILYLFKPVSERLRKFRIFRRFFNWLSRRTEKRAQLVEKYEMLGLILFVAIPLPVTGAWTGCVAATLFKVRLRYAFFAITLGVCIAAAIVTAVYFTGKGLFYHVFIPNY